MRYFKLVDPAQHKTEYIKVLDDTVEVTTISDTVIIEEISEEIYNSIINPPKSRWDLFMPSI